MAGQPPPDRQAALGRAEGQAARELASHQAGVSRFLLLLIGLPFWLPFYVAGLIKERRAMAAFAGERSSALVTVDKPGREIALAWVKQHSERYPHGQYDKRFSRLERRFDRLVQQHREDSR